jgi:hypothetical protein
LSKAGQLGETRNFPRVKFLQFQEAPVTAVVTVFVAVAVVVVVRDHDSALKLGSTKEVPHEVLQPIRRHLPGGAALIIGADHISQFIMKHSLTHFII